MIFAYNLLLFIAYPLLHIAAFFSKRLKKNIMIRKSQSNLAFLKNIPEGRPIYWLHAASVGEYENARALGLALKKKKPDCFLIFSVYSSSAYDQRRSDELPDVFFVLPFDFSFTAKKLVRAIKPNLILYAKYDVWPNLACIASKAGIPQAIFSASLPLTSRRKSALTRKFYRRVYSYLNIIYSATDEHRERLLELHDEVHTLGDTRYDSVAIRAKSIPADLKKLLKGFIDNKKQLIIAGSTYLTSETFLIDAIKELPDAQLILAPHHIDDNHLQSLNLVLEKSGTTYIYYTELQKIQNKHKAQILVIDIMGILPWLYGMGQLAYVGGGWQGSIHSVLEPAFFGLPVLSGPYMLNSQEAIGLREKKLLTLMKEPDKEAVFSWINGLRKNHVAKGRALKAFYAERMGASDRLVKDFKERGFL